MPLWIVKTVFVTALVLVALSAAAYDRLPTGQVADQLRSMLQVSQNAPHLALGREALQMQQSLPRFYQMREYGPAWVEQQGISPQAEVLLDVLRSAALEGLCPEDYHLDFIETLVRLTEDSRLYGLAVDARWLVQLDLLLSDAFLLYASHMIQGRVDPEVVHDGWKARPRKADLAKLLNFALNNHRLEKVLRDLVPPHREYEQLREALAHYRRISALGGWPKIPAGNVLRPGQKDARLPLIRQRLMANGDLVPPEVWNSETEPGDFAESPGEDPSQLFVDVADLFYEPATVRGLKRFQKRHGLSPDGVLGPRTLAALNVNVEERIRQIEINLERWRWLPKSLGERRIEVNTADFNLRVIEGDRTVMNMPVIVGTGYRKTPVFSARMTYLEFAPYWYVPPTILREDKLPLIKKDPGWVQRRHFDIVSWKAPQLSIDPWSIDWTDMDAERFPGVLRMRPGPWNPLGRVKFMFPNRYAVYLHDTNERHLFRRHVRSFSSGCIRIERPLDLAAYLMAGQGWDCDALIDAMGRKRPQQVELEKSLPVHILYWTSWVDERGRLQFRQDLYHRDIDLDLALLQRPPEE